MKQKKKKAVPTMDFDAALKYAQRTGHPELIMADIIKCCFPNREYRYGWMAYNKFQKGTAKNINKEALIKLVEITGASFELILGMKEA